MNHLNLKEKDYLYVARTQSPERAREAARTTLSLKLLSAARGLLLAAVIVLFAVSPVTFTLSFTKEPPSSMMVFGMVLFLYGCIGLLVVSCVAVSKSSKGKLRTTGYFRIGNVSANRFIAIDMIGIFITIWRNVAFAESAAGQLNAGKIIIAAIAIITALFAASLILSVWNKFLLYKLTPEDYIDYEFRKI